MSNLKKLRESKGITQARLAEMVGTSQPTINRIEKGSQSVSLHMLSDIAEALGVPVWLLLADDRAEALILINQAYLSAPPDVQQAWVDLAEAALRRLRRSDKPAA